MESRTIIMKVQPNRLKEFSYSRFILAFELVLIRVGPRNTDSNSPTYEYISTRFPKIRADLVTKI